MKRKTYIIAYGPYRVVKHAWNTAMREIERLVSQMAQAEGQDYRLTDSGGERDALKNHVSGFREWTRADGAAVRFEVWREE